jgi:hypothetical protein
LVSGLVCDFSDSEWHKYFGVGSLQPIPELVGGGDFRAEVFSLGFAAAAG